MTVESLSISEALRLASVVASAMIYIFGATCSYYLERRNRNPPMFALFFLLLAWVFLTLGTGISGLGRYFPVLLIGAPLLSGYIGPALYIHTRQMISPHNKVNLRWLFLGCFGTIYSLLALVLPNGLEPAVQRLLFNEPYFHPVLSSLMILHSIQLASFILVSTFLITRSLINDSNPSLRRTQFWLMIICWTCVVGTVFANILPSFQIVRTDFEPALALLPIAIVGGLSIKALGEESSRGQLTRIEERKVRMESLGRMARGMAHDLNNVLSMILGYAEIAKLNTEKNNPIHFQLDQVIFGTQRAAMLIDRMLTYSGKRSFATQCINPTELIRPIFESVESLQPSSVSMNIEISPNLPMILMNTTDFDSTIQNLLQNSVNALKKDKGRVILRAAYELDTFLPEDVVGNDINGVPSLRIEVEDSGCGMSFEESSRALEPFFSSKPNGIGLGLVNVLSAVEGAGGALWFQSEQHIGTRFVFWIPESKITKSSNSESVRPSVESVNVLLVDDDRDVADVLKRMLDNIGIVPIYYSSSKEVMSLIEEGKLQQFDLAVLDIRMSEVDGIELGHHLLHEQIVRSLLFISGDEPGQRIHQFDTYNVQFMRKPFSLQQLKDSFANLLSD